MRCEEWVMSNGRILLSKPCIILYTVEISRTFSRWRTLLVNPKSKFLNDERKGEGKMQKGGI